MTLAINTTERTYNFIRERLILGKFNPADRLREAEIANEIGVSRTPVREALRRLQSEGLIEQKYGCGVSVKAVNARELREVFEVRMLLECHAASHVAGHLTSSDIKELESLCEQVHQVAHVVRVGKLTRLEGELYSRSITADLTFHRKLVAATGNSISMKMLDDLHILGRVGEYAVALPEPRPLRELADTWREHVMILRAITRGDAAAARECMARHLKRGLEQSLTLLAK